MGERWSNTDTVLWGVSHTGEFQFLFSEACGYVIVKAIYGKKEMTFVVLEGTMPNAGPFLVDALGNDPSFHLEVYKHDECGPLDDYRRADIICRLTNIEVIRRHISNLTILSPADRAYVACRVLIKCKVEWFWKGEQT